MVVYEKEDEDWEKVRMGTINNEGENEMRIGDKNQLKIKINQPER